MKQWKVSARNIDKSRPDIEWLIAAEDEDEAAGVGFKKAKETPNASDSSIDVDQYPLDTEGREDREEIIIRLFDALRMTREYMDLDHLEYKDLGNGVQHVIAKFEGGGTRTINVSCDSGIAMIKDILKGLQ